MPRRSKKPALSMPACSLPSSASSPSQALAASAVSFIPRATQRAASAALLSPAMALFLGEKSFHASVHAARFLPHDSEDHNQIGIHRIFYKYLTFFPDSTPTLSPTLERAPQAI